MNKNFKKTLLLLFIISSLTLGCTKKENLNTPSTNVSSGVNVSGGTNPSTKLEEKITSSGAIAENGNLIVFVKNGNDLPIDLKIEVEFYDADGIIVGSESGVLEGVGANAEIVGEVYDTPNTFDNYKIYTDVQKTTYKTYFDKIELSHNIVGDEIIAQVKNNSNETIHSISVSIVYYRDEKVVGYDSSSEYDIKPERSANIKLQKPYDRNYNDVKFDTYKVYVNQAYSF